MTTNKEKIASLNRKTTKIEFLSNENEQLRE